MISREELEAARYDFMHVINEAPFSEDTAWVAFKFLTDNKALIYALLDDAPDIDKIDVQRRLINHEKNRLITLRDSLNIGIQKLIDIEVALMQTPPRQEEIE